MRIVLLNYAYDDRLPTATTLLERYGTLTGWADALAAQGLDVVVLQRFRQPAELVRRGVSYRLIDDAWGSKPRLWQISGRVERAARGLRPDLVHVNGLLFPLQVRALRATLGQESAIVVQHHAEQPWSGWRGPIQRWGLRAADGFMFAAGALARVWQARGAIAADAPVFEIMEGSTFLRPLARDAARAETGLTGAPQLLWVGRLDHNKDPLTVLDGFELLLGELPRARLAMLYHEAPLLSQVRRRIGYSPQLSRAVTLLGERPHQQLAAYYSSADFFVLGSHYEGSGYALCEALACGVVPLVADIPSFRIMTGGAAAGALWSAGEPEAFAAALRRAVSQDWTAQSAAARGLWEARLSWPRIGHAAAAAYSRIVERRAAVVDRSISAP